MILNFHRLHILIVKDADLSVLQMIGGFLILDYPREDDKGVLVLDREMYLETMGLLHQHEIQDETPSMLGIIIMKLGNVSKDLIYGGYMED